jgi:hypothetical protein
MQINQKEDSKKNVKDHLREQCTELEVAGQLVKMEVKHILVRVRVL